MTLPLVVWFLDSDIWMGMPLPCGRGLLARRVLLVTQWSLRERKRRDEEKEICFFFDVFDMGVFNIF